MRKALRNILLGVIVLIGACQTDEPAPVLQNPIPIIRYLSISPKIVTEFTDSVIVEFEYKDGDGDLGHKDPDFAYLSVQDARLKNPDFYYVPPLAPIGSNITIEGKLRIKVRNTFLLGAGGDELTSYEIRMRDRAGNWSNYINTENITIKR
jgi:hypothetical protein